MENKIRQDFKEFTEEGSIAVARPDLKNMPKNPEIGSMAISQGKAIVSTMNGPTLNANDMRTEKLGGINQPGFSHEDKIPMNQNKKLSKYDIFPIEKGRIGFKYFSEDIRGGYDDMYHAEGEMAKMINSIVLKGYRYKDIKLLESGTSRMKGVIIYEA
jgi:hypothetical protein